jgi:hypothetical protein
LIFERCQRDVATMAVGDDDVPRFGDVCEVFSQVLSQFGARLQTSEHAVATRPEELMKTDG